MSPVLKADPRQTGRFLDAAADQRLEGLVDAAARLVARLASDPDTEAGLAQLIELDERARAHIHAIIADSATRAEVLNDHVLGLCRDVSGMIGLGYQSCAERLTTEPGASQKAVCHRKLMRVAADRVKWEHLAGGPSEAAVWVRAGGVFQQVVGDNERLALVSQLGHDEVSSVVGEYLRALAIYTAGLSSLPRREAWLACRLAEGLLPFLALQRAPSVGGVYYLDATLDGPPKRMLQFPPVLDGIWFLVTRAACDKLNEYAELVSSGQGVPGWEQEAVSDEDALRIINHVLRHWSSTPPVRRYRRHRIDGRLGVLRTGDDLGRLFASDTDAWQQIWELTDISRGGIGAQTEAGAACAEGLSVGELIGVRMQESHDWQLAVIRRLWQATAPHIMIGMDVLSVKPSYVNMDDGKTSTGAVLCDPMYRGEAVRILLPVGTAHLNDQAFITAGGSITKLRLLEGAPINSFFELRVYQVL